MNETYYLIETGQIPAPKEVPYSQGQARWLELGFGAMLHWGINTVHDKEWSDGTLDPSLLDLATVDPEPLMEQLAQAGFRYIVPTTKHIDGFCIWSTDTSDYGVRHCPNSVDVLGRIVNAARSQGLAVGFYYSLWDRRHPLFDQDVAFAEVIRAQLTELLSDYGEIVELWIDGGWHKGGVDYQDTDAWQWRSLTSRIRELQPNCQIGVNGTTDRPGEIIMYPCDFLIGEKRLVPDALARKVYWCEAEPRMLPFEMVHTASAGAGSSDLFADGKWFWHADDHSVRSAASILEERDACRALPGNYLLSFGPDPSFRLRPEDAHLLKELSQARS